jgi:uncharacterized protein YjiS (DUF1127 family)
MISKANRTSQTSIHNSTVAFLQAIGVPLIGLVVSLESWRRRQQRSMQLAQIDARSLRDAGISEARRFIEINKPFRD